MKLVKIKEIYRNQADFDNAEVNIGGWIRTMRVSKNFGFIDKLGIFGKECLRKKFGFIAKDDGVLLRIEAQHVSGFSEGDT